MFIMYKFDDYDCISDDLLERIINMLPDNRKLKAHHYINSDDKISCAVSYLMLVYILKNHFEICNPQICYNNLGKPYLIDHPEINFNISHCRLGCVCAVSDKKIGVDIQDIRAISKDVIEKVCHENEKRLIRKSNNADREFAKIWTMKESYLKMIGIGIVSDLNEIDTTIFSDNISFYDCEKYFIAVTIQEE